MNKKYKPLSWTDLAKTTTHKNSAAAQRKLDNHYEDYRILIMYLKHLHKGKIPVIPERIITLRYATEMQTKGTIHEKYFVPQSNID